ncbi:hypothetical protein [Aquimarina hainanensis]|uniref:hypothetical protein n=1 Tax=Aquimarina hainanensis TaxID=1578017 RepID=UPI00361FACD9
MVFYFFYTPKIRHQSGSKSAFLGEADKSVPELSYKNSQPFFINRGFILHPIMFLFLCFLIHRILCISFILNNKYSYIPTDYKKIPEAI